MLGNRNKQYGSAQSKAAATQGDSRKSTLRRISAATAAVLAVLMVFFSVGGLLLLCPYAKAEMDLTLLEVTAMRAPSALYAYQPALRAKRKGDLHESPSSTLTESRPRVYVAYHELPPLLVNAFVAIEDKRFWEHHGVDLLRTLRAGIHYLRGNASFGGSTITQQLVKNLTGNDRHTPDRKLTEIFQALDLERKVDKTRILEAYLNVINLADGCYGVGAAARHYFSKSVSELTLSECASIAAITNNPTRYNPLTHPDANRGRRDLILREMEKQGYITAAERDEAMRAPVEVHLGAEAQSTAPTSWYTDLVVSDVIRDLRDRLGYSYEAASLLVYQGGLRIETAMDETLQRAVESYYADPTHFPTGTDGRPQSSFLLMDPSTGDVLAVAGAIGEKKANRLQNYATDTRRPTGSCIKPLTVYAPALQEGWINWATLYEDSPLLTPNGLPWPSNADGQYRGAVTVAQAVAHSLNPVAVRILEELGTAKALAFARDRLGMTNLMLPSGGNQNDQTLASLALGQHCRGVTVRELTAAYTVFTDGFYRPPVTYHRVLDREGRVLLENPLPRREDRVLSVENAAIMTKLLSTVTKEGTAARGMTLTSVETAGKTGTTQNNCDRWFVGYTPRLLAGVWMGYDYPAELKGIQGNPCVTIWNQLMETCEALYDGAPPKATFDIPHTLVELEFCPTSGKLRTQYCDDPVQGSESEIGWFVRGQRPIEPCDKHSEPPIRWIPNDPSDPDRIPLLPDDLIGRNDPIEGIDPTDGRKKNGRHPPSLPRFNHPFFDFFRKRKKQG